MNFWKPIALCSIAALGMTIAPQMASAGEMKGEGTLNSGGPIQSNGPIQGGPCFDQHHMSSALSSMRAARGELDHAEHNKDGWRDSAIKNIDQAIHDTDKGCAWADHH